MTPEEPLFIFRALIEWSNDYGVFLARCLETGSVATADNAETVEDMIKELLSDETTFALTRNNLADIYSSPAPLAVWLKYQRVKRNSAPQQLRVRLRDQDIPATVEIHCCAAEGGD